MLYSSYPRDRMSILTLRGEVRGLGERPQMIPHVGTHRVECRPGAQGELRIGHRCDNLVGLEPDSRPDDWRCMYDTDS
jgi:hypothetical protein